MMTTSIESQARDLFRMHGEDIGAKLERYEIPDDKIEKVIEHAIRMKANSPMMNNARVVRKTVAHFKLKPFSEDQCQAMKQSSSSVEDDEEEIDPFE